MQAVDKILEAHGYESVNQMAIGDHVEVEVPGFMPLVIEKVGTRRISVAHYYRQMGDRMSDPEIVFDVLPNGRWCAVEYTQHPYIYQHDEDGLVDATHFALNTWDKNLEQQGFVEAARQAVSASVTDEVTA
jgi:hypothetical protein